MGGPGAERERERGERNTDAAFPASLASFGPWGVRTRNMQHHFVQVLGCLAGLLLLASQRVDGFIFRQGKPNVQARQAKIQEPHVVITFWRAQPFGNAFWYIRFASEPNLLFLAGMRDGGVEGRV